MRCLRNFLPAFYRIAGYSLEIRRERRAGEVFCPEILDAFAAEAPSGPADFTLTIQAQEPKKPDGERQLTVTDDKIILNYGTESERLYLESDRELSQWKLYTTYRDGNVDDWFEKVGNLFAWAMPGKGSLAVHGVLMEWQGSGILLTAASGTGKTTHARLWRDCENALIINGDRVLLRRERGQWYGYGIPWSGSSGECVNRKVCLKAVVFLGRGTENTVGQIGPLAAAGKLFPRILSPDWDEKYAAAAIDLAISCLEEVPLFELFCRPDADAVKTLKNAFRLNPAMNSHTYPKERSRDNDGQ